MLTSMNSTRKPPALAEVLARQSKPWMHARPGETEAQRVDRVAHSCYRCGRFERDMAVLADHEDGCGSLEASPPPKVIKR